MRGVLKKGIVGCCLLVSVVFVFCTSRYLKSIYIIYIYILFEEDSAEVLVSVL